MDEQHDLDDLTIENFLNAVPGQGPKFDFLSRDLEPGEKADDAVDYEDIDDDDLADDEDQAAPVVSSSADLGTQDDDDDDASALDLDRLAQSEELPLLADESADNQEFDDLFGDLPSSNLDEASAINGLDVTEGANAAKLDLETSFDLPPSAQPSHVAAGPAAAGHLAQPDAIASLTAAASQEALFRKVDFGTNDLPSIYVPPPPETSEEALKAMWPRFNRKEMPKWMELLPPKRARYIGKQPLKVPKPIQPTRLHLELAADSERAFRMFDPNPSTKRKRDEEAEQNGIVVIEQRQSEEATSDEDKTSQSDGTDNEDVGGYTLNDLSVICADWDTMLAAEASEDDLVEEVGYASGSSDDDDDLFKDIIPDVIIDAEGRATKRPKLTHPEKHLVPISTQSFPSLNDPERATARIARSVVLDLNDPHLLVDFSGRENGQRQRHRVGSDLKRDASGSMSRDLTSRYNISNDEAYNLLKENHQSKVRSTLSTLTVEHSLPALKLQYPYYKVKLARQEARSFHRPAMSFLANAPVRFSRLKSAKKKVMKTKGPQEAFQTTKDLSLADNSSSLLLEYSEEYPTSLSNFGMGNRILNYYRRKDAEDPTRPKLEVGETTVLLPQDKSPFSAFGSVDAGEVVPTLHNGMYRSPVFKHEPNATDFLVVRNTTGVEGSSWYMRNLEHLYVVGQQFPMVDVPGPHSRKVTTASKNRLKMIAFRKIRKNRPRRIAIGEVTRHFPDSTDMQNRQKMKEFLQFSKEHKEWEMKAGEQVPEEEQLRNLVKPEDVCLLEAAQVGLRHLQDSGYGKDAEDSGEDEGNEAQSLEQQLAPWNTTRNFLHATQGKAMLQLHGEGDPSGRGEAFSFIKTSMKGGFKALGESVEDKLDAKKLKELGGHSYNVAKQQKAYEDSIRRIWEAQRKSLSSTLKDQQPDGGGGGGGGGDDEVGDAPEDLFEDTPNPRSEVVTPAAAHGDELASQYSRFSKLSNMSQRGKILRIHRETRKGKQIERTTVEVKDPRVIREYLKRRHLIEAENTALADIKPTGNAEEDRRNQKRIAEELARLERNKDRRIARDKQKGLFVGDGSARSPGSPSSPAAGSIKSTGTQRKCANCGQVGHIKTNKKLCPMLNGEMKQDDGFSDAGFSTVSAPTSGF
ncbi:MAG: hypothetical protein M1825_001712 [Sarcosagium campestre]|nr:MAG: hypothetical protein M1825_001712 [Sarcosagium campestre]